MGKISEKQQKFTVESDKAILGELKGRLKKALELKIPIITEEELLLVPLPLDRVQQTW